MIFYTQRIIHGVWILPRNFKSADVLLNIELSLFPGLNSEGHPDSLSLKMENPSKADIAQVFKKLRASAPNKVNFSNFLQNIKFPFFFVKLNCEFCPQVISQLFSLPNFRFVLIVVVKILLGQVPLMECIFASIVQAFTEVLAFT